MTINTQTLVSRAAGASSCPSDTASISHNAALCGISALSPHQPVALLAYIKPSRTINQTHTSKAIQTPETARDV